MRNEFSVWHRDLPRDLAIDTSQDEEIILPHVLQLQYVSEDMLV